MPTVLLVRPLGSALGRTWECLVVEIVAEEAHLNMGGSSHAEFSLLAQPGLPSEDSGCSVTGWTTAAPHQRPS